MAKLNWPGSATPTIARPKQPPPNPTPNMTPEAKAAAAKKDAPQGQRTTVREAFRKLIAPAPKTTSSNQSAAVLADKRDQAKKLKGEY